MKIYNGIEEFTGVSNPVLTTGTFDGVHVGHRKIIDQLNQTASKIDGESVLFTFHPHPRLVLFPENNNLKLLNTQPEKIRLLEKAGLQHLIVHPFTKGFSRLTALEYVRDVLVNQIGVKELVIGYDHHFGRNREGSFEELKKFSETYGFKVQEIPPQDIDNVKVSSTKIRKALLEGNVEQAAEFLCAPYPLSGTIVSGDGIGRKLGFPTANIQLQEKTKLIPQRGVYAVVVTIEEKKFKGMLNIGTRPTVSNQEKETIELNILNFDGDLYGKYLTVHLIRKIRDEKKFASMGELKEQLLLDKETTANILS